MSLIHDPTILRLGYRKRPADQPYTGRVLRMADYLAKDLPPPPPACDWTGTMGPLGAMGNNSVGDCTCASAGHLIQSWTGAANPPAIIPSDADILAAYSAITGYNPADPSTDKGAFPEDVLNYWMNTGIAGHKIAGWVLTDWTNQQEVEQVIDLFGGIYLCAELPVSAQSQNLWDVTNNTPGDRGSWGGHAIPGLGYSPASSVSWLRRLFGDSGSAMAKVVTWGATKQLTFPWLAAYGDFAAAIVSQDWLERANQETPTGLNLAQLQADLPLLRYNP